MRRNDRISMSATYYCLTLRDVYVTDMGARNHGPLEML